MKDQLRHLATTTRGGHGTAARHRAGRTSIAVVALTFVLAALAAPSALGAVKTQQANVPVGDRPEAVAARGAARVVFVANRASNRISVVNAATRTVTATFTRPAGGVPIALAADASRTRLYDLDLRDRLLVRNAATGVIARTVLLPQTTPGPRGTTASLTPQDVAVIPGTNRIYVTAAAAGVPGFLFVINGASFEVVARIPVGLAPAGVAVAPGLSRAFVANAGADTFSVVNTATNAVVRTVEVGDDPQQLAFLPGDRASANRLIVSNRGSNSISVVRVTATQVTVLGRVTVGSEPLDVAANAAGPLLDRVYVTNRGSGSVTALERSESSVTGLRVLETVAVASSFGVAVEPQTHRVVVSSSTQDRAAVLARFEPLLHGFGFANFFTATATVPVIPGLTTAPFVLSQIYGLCGGMAFAALDTFNLGKVRPAITATPNTGPVHDYLFTRLLDTFGADNVATWLALDALPTADTATPLGVIPGTASLIAPEVAAMRASLDAGRPVPLGLLYVGPTLVPTDAFNNHQVLAIGRFVAPDGEEVIEVYEPNFPDTTSFLFTQQRIRRGVNADGTTEDLSFRGLFVVRGYQTKTPTAW